MIPKKIHYCWFGGKAKPESAKKCIASWLQFFPDYEIKEWNEQNFDVNLIPYTQEAYQACKYAFVSDVARFWVLYHEGGLYFDTDVEVIASFDDIIKRGAFVGTESLDKNDMYPKINPGLALGAEVGNKVMKSIYEYYRTLHYQTSEGIKTPGTVVAHTTYVLKTQFGLKPIGDIQKLDGITVYPMDYFCPFDDLTGVLKKTNNTRSIHWFAKSWTDQPMWYFRITRFLHRSFGIGAFNTLKSIFGIKDNH